MATIRSDKKGPAKAIGDAMKRPLQPGKQLPWGLPGKNTPPQPKGGNPKKSP